MANVNGNLKCINCGLNLKLEGTSGKADGEYRIFTSEENPKHPAGSFMIIQCLSCFIYATSQIWIEVNKKPLE